METKFDVDQTVLPQGKVMEVTKDDTGIFYKVKVFTAGNKNVELIFEEEQLTEKTTESPADPTDPTNP